MSSEPPPSSSSLLSLATRWTRTIPTLRVNAMRVAYLRAEIRRHPIDAVAVALNELSGRAEQAEPVPREVLAALLPLLTDPEVSEHIEALRRTANAMALLALARLLRTRPRAGEGFASSPPSSGVPLSQRPASSDAQVPTSSSGRPLTLGERKSIARRPSRQALEKMLKDPHPMVIRNLLDNPRMTEDDLVRLAARRPAYSDIIVEIARHPSWSQRPRVRMAIVQNPGTPAEVAVPMVRLLIRPELLQVIGAVDVAPVVRAAASELLERRPPVPERGDKGMPQ